MAYQNLTIGSKGEEVKALQQKLGITADGIYGPQTAAAVKNYQTQQGLAADSIAGPITQGKLYGPTTTPNDVNSPLPSSTLLNVMGGDNPASLVNSNQNLMSTADFAAKLAQTQDTGTPMALANTEAKYQSIIAKEKEKAAAEVELLKGEVAKQYNSTVYQDKLDAEREKFDVENTITAIKENQAAIAAARDALNQGLIAEQGRPVRAQILSGAMATLQSQSIAKIGALQSIGQLLQGNLDIAKAMIDQTFEALQLDDKRSTNALNTLLDMADKRLTTLTDEERDSVKRNIKNIEARAKAMSGSKDSNTKLMLDNAYAWQKGGASLTASYEENIQRMLPYLSQANQQKLFGASDPVGDEALQGYIADIASYGSADEARSELEANKALIIADVGQAGYDQIAAAIDTQFGGGRGDGVDPASEFGKGAFSNVSAADHAKYLFDSGYTTPGSIRSLLINNGYSQAAAAAASNEYYTTGFDRVIGNIGDYLFND